jgi:hypothetical protein
MENLFEFKNASLETKLNQKIFVFKFTSIEKLFSLKICLH